MASTRIAIVCITLLARPHTLDPHIRSSGEFLLPVEPGNQIRPAFVRIGVRCLEKQKRTVTSGADRCIRWQSSECAVVDFEGCEFLANGMQVPPFGHPRSNWENVRCCHVRLPLLRHPCKGPSGRNFGQGNAINCRRIPHAKVPRNRGRNVNGVNSSSNRARHTEFRGMCRSENS